MVALTIASLGGLALFAVLGLILLTREACHTRETYEALYELMGRDLEAARSELGSLRVALIPALRGQTPMTLPPSKQPRKNLSLEEILNDRRTPWQLRFKQAMRLTDTRQVFRDRIQDAIQKQVAAEEKTSA